MMMMNLKTLRNWRQRMQRKDGLQIWRKREKRRVRKRTMRKMERMKVTSLRPRRRRKLETGAKVCISINPGEEYQILELGHQSLGNERHFYNRTVIPSDVER